jgi:hypothetical protein
MKNLFNTRLLLKDMRQLQPRDRLIFHIRDGAHREDVPVEFLNLELGGTYSQGDYKYWCVRFISMMGNERVMGLRVLNAVKYKNNMYRGYHYLTRDI